MQWDAELLRLFQAVSRTKRQHSMLHVDDLRLFWAQMLVELPSGSRSVQPSTHLRVDQDQKTQQRCLMTLLAARGTATVPRRKSPHTFLLKASDVT